MKPKTCKSCGVRFVPERQFQSACNYKCAIALAQERNVKALERKMRADTRKRKQKLKTRSDWLREAQNECNAFIRQRDGQDNCISCGRNHSGQYHAGHYRSVGSSPELRFHPWNIHKQCAPCNNHKSGNAVDYRIRLVQKIGVAAVEWLERQDHQAQKYTISDAQEIKAYFKEQLKLLRES